MINTNPLDAVGSRETSILPLHFSTVEISYRSADEIKTWIANKLSGRFCITRTPGIDAKDGKLKTLTFAAFEDQKELTYFMLACPYLRRKI